MALGERVEGVREREDDVEVGNRQDLTAAGGEPALGGHALAFRAVTVPTRVVGDPLGAARHADGPMAAEHGRAAGRDGAEGATLRMAQGVGGLIRRAMGADDVGQFDPACPFSADARRGGWRWGHDSGAGRLGQIQGRAGGEHAPRRDV